MQTMMVEVNSTSALKVLCSLSKKKEIKILDEPNRESPSLPGAPLSLDAFRNWVQQAEWAKTVSLEEAKNIWAGKKEELQKKLR